MGKCTWGTKYYSGEVTKANRDGTYDIRFVDGERKSGVKKKQIKTKEKPKKKKSKRRDDDRDDADTSDAEDEISRGDKVEAKCTGWTKYYSGEVTKVNRDGTYDIRFVDGERKSGVKKKQIKTKEKPKKKKSKRRDDDSDDADTSDAE